MSITIAKAGLLSTVQDKGRFHFRKFGINPNGFADKFSASALNILLGNNPNNALIEFCFPAPVIAFNKRMAFATAGANFSPALNGNKISNWRVYLAEKGDVLEFTKPLFGNYCYFGISGSFKLQSILESYSTNLKAGFGGFLGRALVTGDYLDTDGLHFRNVGISFGHSVPIGLAGDLPFRVLPGTEFDYLDDTEKQKFLNSTFTIESSDRMGIRLHGESLKSEGKEIIPSGISEGTIQLLPDGQLIILMSDHQTTGGYPRIANVISSDIPRLAQQEARNNITFELINTQQAEKELLRLNKFLAIAKTGIEFTQKDL
ncbi:MAG TPA: biotin-dependent carboxyltransferase family protein [Pyrinomonadaceae bacterium]|nr:biotin-dependent carboxyltransferase family protein [Pyrinomonadaceae bacterium]